MPEIQPQTQPAPVSPIPANYVEQQSSHQTRLSDFSLCPRVGLRGEHAKQQILKLQLPYPEAINHASQSADSLVVRLGYTEVWLLSGNPSSTLDKTPMDGFQIPCFDSHAWFVLHSSFKPEIMSKICGVDLRPESFPLGAVAQTSVAKISAIVIHHQINDDSVFSLLCDRSLADYFWLAVSDAMQEFL